MNQIATFMNELLVPINPGKGKILFNSFYRDFERANYTEDVLAIEMPNGDYVDLGWIYKDDSLAEKHYILKYVRSTQDYVDGLVLYEGLDIQMICDLIEKATN